MWNYPPSQTEFMEKARAAREPPGVNLADPENIADLIGKMWLARDEMPFLIILTANWHLRKVGRSS